MHCPDIALFQYPGKKSQTLENSENGMYMERAIERAIRKASQRYPILMVCGQRQVGKSTMLNHIKEPTRRYISFGDRQAGV